MSKQKKPLTEPEWMMMNALWGKEPQVLGEIIEAIGDRTDWSYNTYFSYMKILCDKGYAGFHTRGRMKFYYPLIEKAECIDSEGESLLRKLGDGDAEKLLVCMLKKTRLSRDGQEELKKLIDRLSGESEA